MSVAIERIIRIYNRLRRGPVTIDIISKWAKSVGIDVSNRQLYRDLNKLQHLQIADGENVVEFTDEKNRKTWKLEYDGESEKLTQFDINSFFLLKNFAPFCIQEHRKLSIEKFEKIIYKSFSNNKYQQLIEANELYLRRTNYFENMYGEVEHKKIEDLLWALQNKRVLTITKDLLNTANLHITENDFPLSMYPLELVFHVGRVHIGGIAQKDERFLLFAVDDSFDYKLSNETFSRSKYINTYNQIFRKLFGIADPMNEEVYNIEIEFTESMGNSAKNFFFHHSQQWHQLSTGNYILKLHCSIGRELFGFLGLLLDKIKIHEPQVLKDLFVKKAKQIAAIHEHDLQLDEEASNADY